MSAKPDAPSRDRSAPPRREYTTPALTVFGPVESLTSSQSMSGSQMDGGPNNSKT
jgi:hypothetical protein